MPSAPKHLRVLLDEYLPKKLKREFDGCVVFTVTEMGWAGTKNGALMKVASGQYDVFITTDQNLQYQQNLTYADIGVIVLVAINNRIDVLQTLMPEVNKALTLITAGQVVEIKSTSSTRS